MSLNVPQRSALFYIGIPSPGGASPMRDALPLGTDREVASKAHYRPGLHKRTISQNAMPVPWPVIYPPQPRSSLRNTSYQTYDEARIGRRSTGSLSNLRASAPLSPILLPNGQSGSVSSRRRRHSAVHFAADPQVIVEGYCLRSTPIIKFTRKGSKASGIPLEEAVKHTPRLSLNNYYPLSSFHADDHARILVLVQWDHYGSQCYCVPLDEYNGRVQLETVLRRVARACVDFLKAYSVPINADRVNIHHIEEVSVGVWAVKLSAALYK